MPRRRPGFTLIELIAVLGIITVILSLLLPALLRGTEAARRTQCTNNLKQIHLALQSYQAVNEAYPPGVVDGTRPIEGPPNGYRMSWAAMLLPYSEQQAMYAAINFDHGSTTAVNSTARLTTISMLLCPDSGVKDRGGWRAFSPSAAPQGAEIGMSCYVAVHNDAERPIDVDDRGSFYLNSRMRAADVLDGLSQTIFLGEVAAPAAEGWMVGGRATLRNTGSPINGVLLQALGDAGRTEAWRESASTPTALEEAITAGRIEPPGGYVGGMGSRHRGDGAVFAFGDGSVRFLRDSIDPTVYRALGNRSDGEAIDEEAY